MSIQQGSRLLALFFTILATLAGFLFYRLEWQAGVDFDLTGFSWLILNAGRLSVLGFVIVCAGAAVTYWIRDYLNE